MRKFNYIFWITITWLMVGSCTPQPKKPHVILILVDTLRADHLGCYGYSRSTSPHVDQFARENLLFLANRSQAACTFPSVNSLLTSRFATEFYGSSMGIPDEMPYLPAILKGQGYKTTAISASPIVRDKPSRFNPEGGFGRGFDTFVPQINWAPAEQLHDLAMKAVSDSRQPNFLYLHYMDPHGPYAPPPSYERQFAANHEGPDFILEGTPNPIEAMLYKKGPTVPYSDADIQHLVDLYDDEIAYFDQWFGKLIEALKKQTWWEDSLVIFASDHGEEFLEHGHIKHCRCLYDTQTHTPLIIKFPGNNPHGVRHSLTQNLDIVPTILDVLNIPFETLNLGGQSLLPLVQEENDQTPFAFSAQSTQRSVNDAKYKLIVNLENGHKEFYDLIKDPKELADLAAKNPELLHPLATALTQWLEETESAQSVEKSKETEELLRSLGYIQ